MITLAAAGCGGDTAGDEAVSTTSTSIKTTTAIMTSQCTTVGFTPNSEDAASEITATGLSCDEAEGFVRTGSGPRTSSGGPPELDVDGYHCVMTSQDQDPLPRATYECRSDAKTVTFTRS